MGRMMVGLRKGASDSGAPSISPPTGSNSDNGDNGDSDDSSSGSLGANPSLPPGVAQCPNCQCEFNEKTMDVLKPGLPLKDSPHADGGQKLDSLDSAPADPKSGVAQDASLGENAITSALAALRAR